mgnify:CR=1 FL=1|tara:strand:- start:1788 stop:2939 length:1152 start_codon:yes stop_codon:yes gene_type:complete
MNKTNILIYGATGSVGSSAISLIRENSDLFNIVGMTCNNNIKELKKLSDEFSPRKIGIGTYDKNINYNEYFPNKDLYFELDEFSHLIDLEVDIIIFAISGLSILNLSIDLAKSGKVLGVANKESIISLGKIFIETANKNNTKIIPLDSEHNSIYQLLSSNNSKFKSITLTASGGPFLNKPIIDLKDIRAEEAIKHPIWKMGKKISVDSATMVNKGLELIEASYLFNLDISRINVLIHPQSIIHGLITYHDNSIVCYMSYPDMRVPISNLLFGDNKAQISGIDLDLSKIKELNFIDVDEKRFPSIKLSREVAKIGGLAPNGFNYINEKLVNLFLDNKIGFIDIVDYNEATLERFFASNSNIDNPSIEDINEFNKWIDNNIFLGT